MRKITTLKTDPIAVYNLLVLAVLIASWIGVDL